MAKKAKTVKGVILPKGWKHGDVFDIPMKQVRENDWNPNEMTAETFDMLSENVDDVDFLDPLLVVPMDEGAMAGVPYAGMFRIIDGEHRFEQQRLMDAKLIKCVVADPDRLDESEQMRQTVRMNKIKGKMSPSKFKHFVERYMEKSQTPPEDIPHELGFVDEDEFEEILDQARESLPSADMKKEFDAARDEIKTVDDLSMVLNRLFTQFGDTLPGNFMILDFGGKEHVWVRMEKQAYNFVKAQFRRVYAHGYTIDSVLERMLLLLDVDKFVEEHTDFLMPVPEDKPGSGIDDIDDLLED